MDEETNFIIYEGVVVPESVLLKRERSNQFGSIEDLPDEELADPDELGRQFLRQEFAPVLALPVKARKGWIRANVDEDGRVDWGAFGTVDFDRWQPKFDKKRYKIDKLKEELANERIMIEIISARIRTRAKYVIVRNVTKGVLDPDEITDFDMYCLAKRCLRMKRLHREIAELQKKRGQEREERAEKLWGSL